ncbi:segregation/condensation protein A [bacterium]|nr:segregation/condensation protein A [bacterium]
MVDRADARASSGFEVQLDDYSGPLDLFVYLVKQEEQDLLGVSVLKIVKSLARFLAEGAGSDLDAAGEAVLLSAELLFLKSRMLLPIPLLDDEDDDGMAQPAAVLVQRILEYERARAMAESLREKEQMRRSLWFSGDSEGYAEKEEQEIVGASVVDLALAFVGLLSSDEMAQVQCIEREKYPIGDAVVRMAGVLKQKSPASMSDVFSHAQSLREKLVFFLALLELVKFSHVVVFQRRDSFNIKLKLVHDVDLLRLRAEMGLEADGGTSPDSQGEEMR